MTEKNKPESCDDLLYDIDKLFGEVMRSYGRAISGDKFWMLMRAKDTVVKVRADLWADEVSR